MLGGEPLPALGLEFTERPVQMSQIGLGRVGQVHLGQVVLDVDEHAAHRRGDAGMRWDDHGRNTEVLTFDGDRITSAEVYFGWNL